MAINEFVRQSVVFLGIVAGDGSFVPYDTGFAALWRQEGRYFWHLVTAHHVADAMAKTGCPSPPLSRPCAAL